MRALRTVRKLCALCYQLSSLTFHNVISFTCDTDAGVRFWYPCRIFSNCLCNSPFLGLYMLDWERVKLQNIPHSFLSPSAARGPLYLIMTMQWWLICAGQFCFDNAECFLYGGSGFFFYCIFMKSYSSLLVLNLLGSNCHLYYKSIKLFFVRVFTLPPVHDIQHCLIQLVPFWLFQDMIDSFVRPAFYDLSISCRLWSLGVLSSTRP